MASLCCTFPLKWLFRCSRRSRFPPPAPPGAAQLEQAEGEAAEAKDAADQTAAALHELRREMCEVVAENDELRGLKAAPFQRLVTWRALASHFAPACLPACGFGRVAFLRRR